MDANSTVVLARKLMVQHGVGYLSFGFHHYPTKPGIVGRAHYIRLCECVEDIHTCSPDEFKGLYSKITLDEHWISVLSTVRIREVILHEIAHVKAGWMPLGGMHGPVWKRECLKLGIPAEAKFKSDVVPPNLYSDALDQMALTL